jgi:hypothetical protein
MQKSVRKILAGFQFASAEIRLFYSKLPFSRFFIDSERILWFCLNVCRILENKTNVGPRDIVIQLIKEHSLHTLFVIFEKKLKIKKI